MKHQEYIETAREIIETAKTNEDMYRQLKGLALDFAGEFHGAASDHIGRSIWFDGEHSVLLDAGGIGARICYLDGTFTPRLLTERSTPESEKRERAGKLMAITFGVYTQNEGEWRPNNLSLITDVEGTRKYLEFF